MLRGLILAVFICITVSGFGQIRVKVDVYATGWSDSAVVELLSYQRYQVARAPVLKNRFHLRKSLPGGDFYFLVIHDRYNQADTFTVYLDQGNLQLKLSKTSHLVQSEGSPFARDEQSLSSFVHCCHQSLPDLLRVQEWIHKHPESPISVFALDRFLASGPHPINWADIASLYARLRPKALDNILALRLLLDIERLNTLELGAHFPEFSLLDSSSHEHNLREIKSKLILVDFWASWCGPCRLENPRLGKVYHEFSRSKLAFVSISLDRSALAWNRAIQLDSLKWLQLREPNFPQGALEKDLRLKGIPANFMLNDKGIIIGKNLFGRELEDFLISKLNDQPVIN